MFYILLRYFNLALNNKFDSHLQQKVNNIGGKYLTFHKSILRDSFRCLNAHIGRVELGNVMIAH